MKEKIVYVLKNYRYLNSIYTNQQDLKTKFKTKNQCYIETVEIINSALNVLNSFNPLYYFIVIHFYKDKQTNEEIHELVQEEFKEYSGYSYVWYVCKKKKATDTLIELLLQSDQIKIIENCAKELKKRKVLSV